MAETTQRSVAGAMTSITWSAVTIRCTVISLRVRVPVLSEQITVTEPSVSTAGRR